MAGRIRFGAPALYRSGTVVRRVHDALAALDVFDSIRINERTAGVLLHYDEALSAAEIIARVEYALSPVLPELAEESAATRQTRRGSAWHATPARAKVPRATVTESRSWHTPTLVEVLERLGCDPALGLTDSEADDRLLRFGPNLLERQERRSDLSILLEQFNSLPVAMLGVSAAVALATGGRLDAAIILSVVMINAGIGFTTERQAEKTIASLDSMAPKRASVRRKGEVISVAVEGVVPGDLLLLSPGSQVAADARLCSARRLTVDESALTGESLPVDKSVSDGLDVETPLSERLNLLHMGTVVTGGSAEAVVVETGSRTELGQVQALVDTTRPPETPLERQLQQLGTQLGILSGVICAGIFVLGVVRGQPRLEMLNSAISLAVAAVPEGLPAVATTTLAMGIREMNRRDVAVRKIEAVETLGSLQVLCLDKTGTLTRNHMSVVAAQLAAQDAVTFGGADDQTVRTHDETDSPSWQQLLKIAVLCNDADIDSSPPAGSPTEIALLELARSRGLDIAALNGEFPRIETRERAEGRPLMSTVHPAGDGYLVAVKGRPAEVLERCDTVLLDGEVVELDDSLQEQVIRANDRMAEKALRVLGVAYCRITEEQPRDAENLTWIGMLGLQDPLRPGMGELMSDFHRAGIKTVMITGDQSATAYAIGKELGLAREGELRILDSGHLDKVEPELLSALVQQVDVFSRVSPAHKLRIVGALQQSGAVVAMTGDGINDGPALKAADIGVAMGQSGTDIARSVADVVIKDDNLHTMRVAVGQGRTIYANIRKMIHYMLSANFSEIEVMLAGVATGQGSMMNPMQLLWINLVTDIFPGLALSFEPADDAVMEQPPRSSEASIVSRERLGTMAIESAIISAGTLAAFWYGVRKGGPGLASTLAFQTLTLAELLHAWACRSETRSMFSRHEGPRNPMLEKALLGTGALQVLTFTIPGMKRVMGLTDVDFMDLLVIGAGAAGPMLANELYKEARCRKLADERLEHEEGDNDDADRSG